MCLRVPLTSARRAAVSGTRALVVAVVLCVSVSGASAKGSDVRVHDGDTLTINGQRWRLWGVDAPELDQTCFVDAHDTPCGVEAADALRRLVSRAAVSCTQVGRSYDRAVGRCFVGQLDLSAEMVREGFALNYQRYSAGEYAAVEADARTHHRGIWAGLFETPWDWRALSKSAARDRHATHGAMIQLGVK